MRNILKLGMVIMVASQSIIVAKPVEKDKALMVSK